MSDQEYIVVSDKTSEVVLSTEHLDEVMAFVSRIEKCGGECTVFRRIDLNDYKVRVKK